MKRRVHRAFFSFSFCRRRLPPVRWLHLAPLGLTDSQLAAGEAPCDLRLAWRHLVAKAADPYDDPEEADHHDELLLDAH